MAAQETIRFVSETMIREADEIVQGKRYQSWSDLEQRVDKLWNAIQELNSELVFELVDFWRGEYRRSFWLEVDANSKEKIREIFFYISIVL